MVALKFSSKKRVGRRGKGKRRKKSKTREEKEAPPDHISGYAIGGRTGRRVTDCG